MLLSLRSNPQTKESYIQECDSCKVDSVPGPELSQLPSKSALTKRTRWEFLLYCALLIYKTIYLLTFVHARDCCISIESSCC